MAWSLTVGALVLLLVPVPSRSCLHFGLPKGTTTTRACAAQTAAQLEHGNTEHLPQPVVRPENFIIENYAAVDQRLLLSVTLVAASLSDWVKEIISNDDVRVEIYYSTSERCAYVSCPDAHNNTCVVRRFQDIKGYVLIAVNVSDNNGNWKKHCLDKIQTLPRAKAAAVKDFQVMHVNSSTVKVSWTGTVLVEANHPVQYRVKLGASNFNRQVERIYYGTPPIRSQQHLITGLIPHGVYSVTLTVQPITLDDAGTATGMPSDPVSRSVTMPQDVPARNPLWAPGKFSFDQCGDGGGDCQSTVTIYWQPLEEIFRNGMLHYIVTVKKISETNPEELILRENVTGTKTSYQIKDLQKGPTYKIELEAATVNGTNSSADPSVIYLDENALGASPRPSHIESIKAKYHRLILVTWRGAHGSNYSVVWCREGKNEQMGKCEGQVKSQAVGTQTSVKVRMALAEREERHRVGVWMNNGAAGIVWGSCVFQEGVPPKAMPPADIYSKTGHLVVKVKRYSCEDSAVPTSRLKYHVDYCLTNDNKTCSGEVSKESIGPDEINHQFVYPVEPNHFYKVTVYAEAEGGRSPKLVRNQFVPMSTKGPVFGAVFGSLVAVLLITVIIVSLVVYWNHVKKHQVPMERPSTVKLIENEDGDNQEEVFHEQDHMISTCRVESSNPIEECNTGEEELEQHLMARQMQPAEERAISEEVIVIGDYAKVTFANERMNARLLGLGDWSKKRERPGEAVASWENETVEHFPEMVVHPDRTDDDMMSSRSSISNSLESARDLSGNGHCFECIEAPKADDTQMLEAGDNSDDEWSLLYDDVVTVEEETDSEDDGDSVVYPDGYSGAIFGGNNGVKSNGGHSGLHSNGPGVNSNESNSDFHSNSVNPNEIDSSLLSNGVPNGVNSSEIDSSLLSNGVPNGVNSSETDSSLLSNGVNSSETDSSLLSNGVPNDVNSSEIDSSLLSNGVPNGVNSSEIDSSLLSNGVNSSNDEDSGLHSNSMDSNENDSTEEDFDSIEDYSKVRPSTQTNGQQLVLCRLASSEDLDSASGEDRFGWAQAGTHLANELVDDGILESGRDGARMLPRLRDYFMI